jgi:hypothetical protein
MLFRTINVVCDEPSALTSSTISQLKALEKRAETLQEKQDALNKTETEYGQAPLTEIIDWATISKTYSELLATELVLLQDILLWEGLRHKDENAYQIKTGNLLMTTQEEIRKKLLGIGFTEESMNIRRPLENGGCLIISSDEIVACHPSIRKLRLAEYSASSSSDTRDKINACEKELRSLRAKKLS